MTDIRTTQRRARIAALVEESRAYAGVAVDQAGALEAPDEAEDGHGIIVLPEIGGAMSSAGRRVLTDFRDVVGRPLSIVPVPADLADLRRSLLAEFPHAAAVIDSVLRELAGRPAVKLRPMLIVGEPGCGKTTFAARLLELLGVPHTIYGCGGVGDSSIQGTSRRWLTAGPSLPLSLCCTHQTASVGIVLDELEKTATAKANGGLQDALHGLLEPRTAARWHDVYAEAECDLSHVVWVATANSIEGIPPALRDRFRIVRFPTPGPQHIEVMAASALMRAIEDRGLDSCWALPLDGLELDALRNAWKGGSLRSLGRLVDAVLAARDLAPGAVS